MISNEPRRTWKLPNPVAVYVEFANHLARPTATPDEFRAGTMIRALLVCGGFVVPESAEELS